SDAFGTALRTRSGRGRLSWAVRRCSLKGGYHKGDLSLSRLHAVVARSNRMKAVKCWHTASVEPASISPFTSVLCRGSKHCRATNDVTTSLATGIRIYIQGRIDLQLLPGCSRLRFGLVSSRSQPS